MEPSPWPDFMASQQYKISPIIMKSVRSETTIQKTKI